MSFDLSELSDVTNQEGIVSIIHPKTGVELGIKITVASRDSAKYRKMESLVKNRNTAALQRGKRNLSAEAIDAGMLDILAACVVGWEGLEWGGQAIECTDHNIRDVYEKFPFIREQVEEFVNDRGNFISA